MIDKDGQYHPISEKTLRKRRIIGAIKSCGICLIAICVLYFFLVVAIALYTYRGETTWKLLWDTCVSTIHVFIMMVAGSVSYTIAAIVRAL